MENDSLNEEVKSAGENELMSPVYQEGEYLAPSPPAPAEARTWENFSAHACSTPSASANGRKRSKTAGVWFVGFITLILSLSTAERNILNPSMRSSSARPACVRAFNN